MMHNDDTNYNAKQSPKTPIINGHTVELIYVNKFIFLLQLNCLLHHQFHQNASTSKLKQHKEETGRFCTTSSFQSRPRVTPETNT